MLNLLIADDHLAVRLGMEVLVKEVLGNNCKIDMACDGDELFTCLKEKQYDILITDLNMPKVESVVLIEQIINAQPKIKILIVSINPNEILAKHYLQSGAYGYIQKGTDDKEMKDAIRNIALGKKHVTTIQLNMLLSNADHANPFNALSSREFEVAVLLLKGNGLIEISNILKITPSTISTYKGRIFEKLNVINVIELNRLAYQYHIIDDSSTLH